MGFFVSQYPMLGRSDRPFALAFSKAAKMVPTLTRPACGVIREVGNIERAIFLPSAQGSNHFHFEGCGAPRFFNSSMTPLQDAPNDRGL